jgi:hypothetical protein
MFDLRACPAFRIYVDQTACGSTQSRDQIESFNRLALTAEKHAISDVPLATTVDFLDDICTATQCSTQRAGRWLYRDGGHLTVAAAMSLSPRFDELIRIHADVRFPTSPATGNAFGQRQEVVP